VAELDRMLTLDDIVLRHKVLRQPDKQVDARFELKPSARHRHSQGCPAKAAS